MASRIIITGGAGFIGTNLCRHLVDAGHDVTVVDRVEGDRQRANVDLLGGATVVRADLASVPSDPTVAPPLSDMALRRLLEDADVVIHLAGRPGVQTSWGTGFADHLRDNVALSQRLLEATLDVGVGRVVMASSSSVYGDTGSAALCEDQQPQPVSPYGATKAAMELLARTYAVRGVPAVCLRYFTVYGRLQRPDMAISRILSAGRGGAPFPLRGDGTQVRDMTHVDDVVAATVAAASAPLPAGTVLNVGSAHPVSLTTVLRECAFLLGTPVPLLHESAAPGDPRRTSADISRARELLGWQPVVALRDGLADQLRWHEPALATAR